MRLANGIVVDVAETFGDLRFSAFRRESIKTNDDGTQGELTGRVYDLKSSKQERMIQVTLPIEVDEKSFKYNEPVELIGAIISTFTNASFNAVDVEWHLKAADLISKMKSTSSYQPQNHNPNQAPPTADASKEKPDSNNSKK